MEHYVIAIISLLYGIIGTMLVAFFTSQGTFKALLDSSIQRAFILTALSLSLLLYALLYFTHNSTMIAVIVALLVILAIIDMKRLALPDLLNFLLLFLCICKAMIDSINPLFDIMLGFGLGGAIFCFKMLYQSISKRDIIGEADIIVLCSLGIAFGVLDTLIATFAGSLVALAYAICISIKRHIALSTLKLPFCTFLTLGLIGLLIAREI